MSNGMPASGHATSRVPGHAISRPPGAWRAMSFPCTPMPATSRLPRRSSMP